MHPTVSIITVTYNNAPFLDDLIDSVMRQEFADFEWIVVDNGSTDSTAEKLDNLRDPRVKVIHLDSNVGVSAGRNKALVESLGQFICFVDGDDVLPAKSISSRMHVMITDPDIHFVDGAVRVFDGDISASRDYYRPTFRGDPLSRLVALTGEVFFGNTWLIRRQPGQEYTFPEHLTHGEDLVFYASLCTSGKFDFTDETVLYYRRHASSAMRNTEGLIRGYFEMGKALSAMAHVSPAMIFSFKTKAASIILRTRVSNRQIAAGLRDYIRMKWA